MSLTYSRCVDCDAKVWLAPEFRCADGIDRCRRHSRGHTLMIDVERDRVSAERHERRRAARQNRKRQRTVQAA